MIESPLSIPSSDNPLSPTRSSLKSPSPVIKGLYPDHKPPVTATLLDKYETSPNTQFEHKSADTAVPVQAFQPIFIRPVKALNLPSNDSNTTKRANNKLGVLENDRQKVVAHLLEHENSFSELPADVREILKNAGPSPSSHTQHKNSADSNTSKNNNNTNNNQNNDLDVEQPQQLQFIKEEIQPHSTNNSSPDHSGSNTPTHEQKTAHSVGRSSLAAALKAKEMGINPAYSNRYSNIAIPNPNPHPTNFAPRSLKITVFLPESVNDDAIQFEVKYTCTAEQLIKYVVEIYRREHSKQHPDMLFSLDNYRLYIADIDGVIDDDFPPIDKSSHIAETECFTFALTVKTSVNPTTTDATVIDKKVSKSNSLSLHKSTSSIEFQEAKMKIINDPTHVQIEEDTITSAVHHNHHNRNHSRQQSTDLYNDSNEAEPSWFQRIFCCAPKAKHNLLTNANSHAN